MQNVVCLLACMEKNFCSCSMLEILSFQTNPKLHFCKKGKGKRLKPFISVAETASASQKYEERKKCVGGGERLQKKAEEEKAQRILGKEKKRSFEIFFLELKLCPKSFGEDT